MRYFLLALTVVGCATAPVPVMTEAQRQRSAEEYAKAQAAYDRAIKMCAAADMDPQHPARQECAEWRLRRQLEAEDAAARAQQDQAIAAQQQATAAQQQVNALMWMYAGQAVIQSLPPPPVVVQPVYVAPAPVYIAPPPVPTYQRAVVCHTYAGTTICN